MDLENRFTGWIDVPLSAKSREEAVAAGKKLAHYRFDRAFTSRLVRAIETLSIVLTVLKQESIPIEKDEALNERMYGDLQGLNKNETAHRYGVEALMPGRPEVKVYRIRLLGYCLTMNVIYNLTYWPAKRSLSSRTAIV